MADDHCFIEIKMRVPFVTGILNTRMSLAPGDAELLFRPRKGIDKMTERERAEIREERAWRIKEIAHKFADAMLKEIERTAK